MTLPPWALLVDVVSKIFQDVVKLRRKLETAVQPIIGLGFPLICMESVVHDSVWRASLFEVQQRGAHAPNRSATERAGT